MQSGWGGNRYQQGHTDAQQQRGHTQFVPGLLLRYAAAVSDTPLGHASLLLPWMTQPKCSGDNPSLLLCLLSISVAGILCSFPFQIKATLMSEGKGLHRHVSSSLEAGRDCLDDADYSTPQLPSLSIYTSFPSTVWLAAVAGLASGVKRKPNRQK